jgi:adenylate cyclase
MAFFAELQRRRVGKVAVGYGAIAWAVTEGCSVVFPALHVPEWAMTFIVVFLLVGFPVAMVLAWIFDVGPEGIQRTAPMPESAPTAQVRQRAAFGIVVLICMAGLGYLLYERGVGRAHAGEPRSSIAVLPFTNLSGDPAKDYFSDGMSEELLNLLARVPGLQVAARTSAFAYKGHNVDVRKIGKALGVETVLEGSVRQAGQQVRITAQLIDTQTGFHLWSETYDRRLEDIFAVQDEIAQAIVDKLRIELAPEDQTFAQHEKAPTQNVEAYQLYLQGRAIWKRRGEENLRQAIDLYQSALGKDPAFARANAALASAYVVMPGYTEEQGDEEKFYELAQNAARTALAVDPNIGEAHAVLAQINANRGDLLDAESGFFFAISLEPNEATTHQWYSVLLRNVGRLEAALTQAKRALELDPTSPIIAANLAQVYLVKGDDDQALRYSRLAAEEGIPKEIRSQIGPIVDALADPALRPRVVATLQAIDPKLWPLQERVMPYVLLGRTDLAYEVLLDSLDKDHLVWASRLDLSHFWTSEGRPLRTDPRFSKLVERIGMVDYWKQYGYPDSCRAGTDAPIVCS